MKQIYAISLFKVISISLLVMNSSQMNSQNTASLSKSASAAVSNTKFVTKPFENKVFIEEQGQFKEIIKEQDINIPHKILYAVRNAEFNAYFTTKGISFVFYKVEKEKKESEEEKQEDEEEERKKHLLKKELIHLEWLNPSSTAQLTAEEKTQDYYTYRSYENGTPYNHVPAFKKLKYSNIYEGVDAEFELPERGGIKYKFIVRAGHSIPSIAFKINGSKKLDIDKNGNLHIEGSYDELLDNAPNAFTNGREIPVNYELENNTVKFNISAPSILTEDLIIDPWIINPNIPSANNAYDLQVDSLGNVFVNGGTYNNYSVQKYTPGGVLQWTYSVTCYYYGDIAVANPGNVYVAEGSSTAKLTKLNSSGAVIYSITEGAENWRLSFNRSKTILAMGGNFSPNSLTKIDTANGAMVNTVSYPSDTWAIATDCNGDIYSLHHGASPCMLRKTNADFTPAGSFVTSGFCISGYSNSFYVRGINALTISGPYLYIYDGLELRRFQKSTLSFVNSAPVPNGAANSCSGIAFDFCGNIYVGTMTTIEKYDMQLNHVSSTPAPGIVYDLLLSGNGDLLACGNAFVANMGPTCPAPPQLSVTDTSTNASCQPGSAIVFTSGGSAPYSYTWQPGGLTTDTITGLVPGTYTYIVNDAFCQEYEDSVVIMQVTPPTISQGNVTKENCFNSLNGSATVNVTDGSPPYSFSWNTTPAQNTQTATGLASGIYLATVVDADSCWDTISVFIPREPAPVVNFGSTQVCNGANTVFTDSSTTSAGTITSWTWDFGDASPTDNLQNPSHTYSNAGNHSATLIIETSLGCKDTITKNVTVHYNPVASYTHTDVCFGDSMYFSSTSTVHNSSSIVSYLWLFGESSATGSSQNTSHLYNFPGTYTVSLIVTTNNGCKDTITKNVVVHALPVAQFTAPVNVCHGNIASFTDGSTIPNTDTIQSWSWNFADGSPLLNQQTVTGGHLYAAAGTYNVSLITTSTFGCKDTITKTLFVRPKPVANFGSSKVCNGTATIFSDSSTTSAGSINAWGWDFADGGTNITQNPSHLYANAGIHNVTLIAQNTFACADTITNPVQVYFNPVANFTTQDVCLNDSVFFTDSSYVDNSASVSTYLWVFGDGTPTSNIKNPAHFYTSEGTYNVTLLSTTNQNCSNAANKTVHVFDPPTSNFSVADVCLTDSAIFINTSANPSMGSIASVLWNFGDGSLLNNTLTNPHHLYSAVGTYPVTLITRSSNLACADTITDSITVFPMPIADFAAADVCDEQAVNFFDSSTVTNGNTIAAWNWTFGDNGTSTLQNPTRTYTTFGQYSVQLIATTNNGCKDTISKNVVIHPLPVANFSTGNACLGDTTSFTNQSEIPSNTTNDVITAWNWDLGNNTPIVTTTNTSNLYAAMGSYTVELKVITTFGCADS
ncbi:MAG: PKD domain-containing protein, partial [Bacteroidia bacterium]